MLLNILRTINTNIEKIIKQIIIFLMIILIVSTFLQVFTRYVMNDPIAWTIEITRFALIWVVFLSAAIGVRKSEHFSVNILSDFLSESNLRKLNIFSSIVIFSISCYLLRASYYFSIIGITMVSYVLRIPMVYLYGALFVGSFLMVLFAFENLLSLTIYQNK